MRDEPGIRSAPVALILSRDGAWTTIAAATLADAGWSVRCGRGDGEWADIAVVDGNDPALANRAPIVRLRTSARSPGTGLIARIRAADAAPAFAAAYDDRLSPLADVAEIGAVAARWRPHPLPEATLRLRDTFGAAAIDPLLAHFAGSLDKALRACDPAGMPALAHRIAGVAGTLGFGALGRAWLALSEGDDSGAGPLRIASRLAIGAILRAGPNPGVN